jgi:hypothetical protein
MADRCLAIWINTSDDVMKLRSSWRGKLEGNYTSASLCLHPSYVLLRTIGAASPSTN